MKTVQFVCVVALCAFAGCAHTTMRGSVAMKASDSEAHVCMGENEVKAGDKVALFKNVCVGAKGGGKVRDGSEFGGCKKVKLGDGVVERALNEHYSVVKVASGVQFDEGTVVEKQ